MKFNEEKTDLLTFNRGQNRNQQLTVGGTTLNDTAQHKHLSIILQNNCRLDEHIKSVDNKIHMLIPCLRFYKYLIKQESI